MGKGTKAEQELVSILWDKGYAVMRSPASGGVRSEPQPDILASDGGNIFAIECKYTSHISVYIGKEEVEHLKEFCHLFGFSAQPVLAVRFTYSSWSFFRPEDCTQTKKSYRIDRKSKGRESLSGF